MYDPLDQIPYDQLIAEIERRAYKRGYDAGRKYTWHMRNNDKLEAAQSRLNQLAADITTVNSRAKCGNHRKQRHRDEYGV